MSHTEFPTAPGYLAKHCPVFPGISLIYHTSHAETGLLHQSEDGAADTFEIFHCREGRMECSIGDSLCYLSPGDLLIAKNDRLSPTLFFPLRHYHGISIRINVRQAPKCLSCFLQDVAVQPQAIGEKFCGRRACFIARSSPSFEHIFSELYAVPETIRQGYSKIKILELMLFLSVYPADAEEPAGRALAPSQAALAKKAAAYLIGHMDERITLRQMAALLHTSDTAVKSAFRAVYGVSFYAYLKAQKMESAAYMLEYTDRSVTEIAGAHGYDNASKFAVAFRSVKGMAPLEYRTQCAHPAVLAFDAPYSG